MSNEKEVNLLEQKVRSVKNIKVYGKEKLKENLVAGLKYTAPVVAIPITLSVLNNVFGIDFQVYNTPYVGDFLNNFYTALSEWDTSLVGVAAAMSGYGLGTAYETIRDINEMKKLKYYLRNKAIIKIGSEKDLSILDAENISKNELEDYVEKGRSKVLR